MLVQSLGWEYYRWRKAWQPTPGFLPGESHGQRSLVGYSPWGRRVGSLVGSIISRVFQMELREEE